MNRIMGARAVALMFPVASQATPNTNCPNANPQRNADFGDLHVHTALSADAVGYDMTARPDDAYRYAFDGWIMSNAALFLASDEARYASGGVVPVDGGIASRYPTPQPNMK